MTYHIMLGLSINNCLEEITLTQVGDYPHRKGNSKGEIFVWRVLTE